MKKILYIFLILIAGVMIFTSDKTINAYDSSDPNDVNIQVSEFTTSFSGTAQQGTNINISATCRNNEQHHAAPVYLVVSGNEIGMICSTGGYNRLNSGATTNCSGSFTMPDSDARIVAQCYYKDSGNTERETQSVKTVAFDSIGVGTGTGTGTGIGTGTGTGTGTSTGTGTGIGTGSGGPSIVSGGGSVEIQNPLEHDTFDALVQAIVNFVFKIALIIAPLMIIVAGFFYLTAMGDPKKIETAHNVIKYTLIGLAICLMATGIIKLINTVLGV